MGLHNILSHCFGIYCHIRLRQSGSNESPYRDEKQLLCPPPALQGLLSAQLLETISRL